MGNEDKYAFNTMFSVAPKDGVLDFALRYDTVDGHYSWKLEENGLPTTVPGHVITGILMNIILSMGRN